MKAHKQTLLPSNKLMEGNFSSSIVFMFGSDNSFVDIIIRTMQPAFAVVILLFKLDCLSCFLLFCTSCMIE